MINRLLDAGMACFFSKNNDEWLLWAALEVGAAVALAVRSL